LFPDDKTVEPSGRVQVLDPGDLLVAAVKESDAGHYTCIRANEAGEVHASAYLTVLGEGKASNSQLMSLVVI
jgi:protein sidekick